MGFPEELYMKMLEVGLCARRHKIIPGPLASTLIDVAQKSLGICARRHKTLASTLIDVAQKSLELWRQDEKTAMRFAAMVLAGPTNLREATGQLPEPVAEACWRLIGLLEYLASHDGQ